MQYDPRPGTGPALWQGVAWALGITMGVAVVVVAVWRAWHGA